MTEQEWINQKIIEERERKQAYLEELKQKNPEGYALLNQQRCGTIRLEGSLVG